jgi:hypothetical protein
MKILYTLISFICISTISSSQVSESKNVTDPVTNACPLVAAEGNSLIFDNSCTSQTNEVIIGTLPPLSQPATDIYLELHVKGTYYFKISKSVTVPDGYSIVIEDCSTRGSFNLMSSEQHTFSVNRAMTKKFVLRMRKNQTTTAVALN